MKLNATQIAKALRILCAVALLSVGFAHQPVFAFAASSPLSAAYQLPDGTFADICVNHDVEHHKGKMTDHGCEACRLSASIMVPTPSPNSGDRLRVPSDVAMFERPETVHHRLYPPNSGPRAPPTSLMNV